jgi:CheY-like chemotaxis protein
MSRAPLVLIIEDDADLVYLYEILLGLIGSPVETAICRDGRSGLARVQSEPEPRVILLDLHLPYIQGAEIFKMARASTTSTIVVVTADVLAAGDLLGSADHVIVKPFDTAVFRNFLAELLRP